VRKYLLLSLFVLACGSSHEGGRKAESDSGVDPAPEPEDTDKFSFFVTSLTALRELSGSQAGFGGDLRFGETGDGAGLRGADKICSTIADMSMPGSSAKDWRAFLSTSREHAKDRVGEGPWYDRKGRLVARDLSELLKERPTADMQIINDLPNELGVPNHDPDGTGQVDNHDMLTGTNAMGMLYCPSDPANCTCDDWTSSARSGKPRVGHSWPRIGFGGAGGGGLGATGLPGLAGLFGDAGLGGLSSLFGDGGLGGLSSLFGDGGVPAFPGFGDGGIPGLAGGDLGFGDGSMNNWMSALDEAGCAPGVSLVEMGPPQASNATVGSGGGYGGFYCFALVP
jgi:hypothetical protein